jgi:hypothetical protein
MKKKLDLRIQITADTERLWREMDSLVVKGLLGGREVFMAGVARRCPHGYPSVIVLSPGSANEEDEMELNFTSIATPLWLTCPHLNDRIHRLESLGYIKKIETLFREDEDFAEKMKLAHIQYAFFRKNMYKQYFVDPVTFDNLNGVLGTGIGGIRDIETVKCLHLHVAHYYLYEENVVGKAALSLLEEDTFCGKETCKHDCSERNYSHQKGQEGRFP